MPDLKNDLSYGIAEAEEVSEANPSFASAFCTETTRRTVGGEVSFDYKDLFGLSAGTLETLLAVKPSSELWVEPAGWPHHSLQIEVGYDYIERETVNDYLKMKGVNDLHAKPATASSKALSAYVQAQDNLLNKKSAAFWLHGKEFNVLGGLSFQVVSNDTKS